MSEQQHMRWAIEVARRGIEKGQSPFGAAIIREGQLLVARHNTVWLQTDPTAHAEVNAIRDACSELRTIDLSGCLMFTTCEPCPMCLSAIHWARIDRVLYGASIADAAAAGFNELHVNAQELVRLGGSALHVVPGILRDECRQLFEEWRKSSESKSY